ncbi:hypothetical protein B0H19DRAFT_1294977 [Mycena capillaripes]|nr:hypothetical protein B0H19DRAFT_1294977 [Mycena capillaripes]
MYQEDGAEEAVFIAFSKLSPVHFSRNGGTIFHELVASVGEHPNCVQLYGVTALFNIYAAVFHDVLIPFEHFIAVYRHSDVLKRPYSFTLRIHRLTGGLCADLVPGVFWLLSDSDEQVFIPREATPFNAPDHQATIIDALALSQYHEIYYWDLSQVRQIFSSAHRSLRRPARDCVLTRCGGLWDVLAWGKGGANGERLDTGIRHHPLLEYMVPTEITSHFEDYFNMVTQYSCETFGLQSKSRQLENILLPRASYFCAQEQIFKMDRRHSDGQIAPVENVPVYPTAFPERLTECSVASVVVVDSRKNY